MFSTLKDSKILEELNTRTCFYYDFINNWLKVYISFTYSCTITILQVCTAQCSPCAKRLFGQQPGWHLILIMRIRQITLLTYLQDIWLISLSFEKYYLESFILRDYTFHSFSPG